VAVAFGLLTLGVGMSRVPLHGLTGQTRLGGSVTAWLTTAAALVPAAAVGALLAARRPRNPIGWILLTVFLLISAPVSDYLVLDYRMYHGTLPLGWLAVGLTNSWPVLAVLITILLWVFPDGRFPSGRWRRVSAGLAVAGVVLALVVSAGLDAAAAGHAISVDSGGNLISPLPRPLVIFGRVVFVGILASWAAWIIAQVLAFRRASGVRRQQLKWLCSGAAACVTSIVLPGQLADDLISPVGTAALPVCIAVAVLKYRMYAIDRIISRVISYAIITAVLGAIFAGLVILATGLFPSKTPVAVAAATLVAAALFNPLRRRVQRAVDRHFNRARYNAEALVTAFNARLRQIVDLDAVQADLAGTVHQAFEPAHISVWLAATQETERPSSRHQPPGSGHQLSARPPGDELVPAAGIDDPVRGDAAFLRPAGAVALPVQLAGGVRVGVDGEHAAHRRGQPQQLGRRVPALRPAVDLHGDPFGRTRAEHRPGVERRFRPPAAPAAQQPSGAVAEHIHVRVAYCGHHPLGHRPGGHPQLGMHAGHHDVEPAQQVLALVQRAVVQDVDLDPGQDPERRELAVQRVDQLELIAKPFGR
jgi:hypothetical protein